MWSTTATTAATAHRTAIGSSPSLAPASVAATASQRGTPALPARPRKPAPSSLASWDQQFVLSSRARKNAARLDEACRQQPMPAKFASEQSGMAVSKQHDTPVVPAIAAIHSAPAVAATSSDSGKETAPQFLGWLAGIEDEMVRSQEDTYRGHLAMLSTYLDSVKAIHHTINHTLQHDVDNLERGAAFVRVQTSQVTAACELPLREERELIDLANELANRLRIFAGLSQVMRVFTLPGDDVCRHPQFLPSLQHVDMALEYLSEKPHSQFRDAELYRMRFEQCLTRGLALLKAHITSQLMEIGEDIRALVGTDDVPVKTTLYVRFRAACAATVPFIGELQKRAVGASSNSEKSSRGYVVPSEHRALLRDCLVTYLRVRNTLVIKHYLEPELEHIVQRSNGNIVDIVQEACSLVMGVCGDEQRLCGELFGSTVDTSTSEKAHASSSGIFANPSMAAELNRFLEAIASHLPALLVNKLAEISGDADALADACHILMIHIETTTPLPQDEYNEKGSGAVDDGMPTFHSAASLVMSAAVARLMALLRPMAESISAELAKPPSQSTLDQQQVGALLQNLSSRLAVYMNGGSAAVSDDSASSIAPVECLAALGEIIPSCLSLSRLMSLTERAAFYGNIAVLSGQILEQLARDGPSFVSSSQQRTSNTRTQFIRLINDISIAFGLPSLG